MCGAYTQITARLNSHLRKEPYRKFDSLRSHPGIDSLRASASDCRKHVCGFVRHHRMIPNTDSNQATWTMLHELKWTLLVTNAKTTMYDFLRLSCHVDRNKAEKMSFYANFHTKTTFTKKSVLNYPIVSIVFS